MIVRNSILAGSWYPRDKNALIALLEDYFQDVKKDNSVSSHIKKNATKIIAPHAGYIYSGKCAAYAYHVLKTDEINKIIILSPSHSAFITKIALPSADAFETPLGTLFLDQQCIEKYRNSHQST